MKSKLVLLLVTAIFVATACSGTSGVPVTDTPEPSSTMAPTSTILPPTKTQTLVKVEPTQTPINQIVSECTLVSSLPDPPQEYAGLFDVNDNDWVIGPEDAAVTLIEYGDFQ